MPVATSYPVQGPESITAFDLFSLPPLEIWRPVLYRGETFIAYEVSSQGRVRRCLPPKRGESHVGKIISRGHNQQGYPLTGMGHAGRHRNILLHHLVAEAFMGPRPEKYHINHIDGDKENAAVDNLEYCTASENMRHAVRTGLKTSLSVQGEKHPLSKLTGPKVAEIKRLLQAKEQNPSQIARQFGVSHDLICNIRDGKTWKHILISTDSQNSLKAPESLKY